MDNKKENYHVIYVENATQKIKSFECEIEMYKFVAEFASLSYNNPDNWVEIVFNGVILIDGRNNNDN